MQEERAPEVGKGRPRTVGGPSGPLPLADIESGWRAGLVPHVGESARILGGERVGGYVVLLGGDPGMGKPTVLLQILPHLAQPPERVFYVAGEESPRQIKMRCERLGIDSEALLIYPETNLEEILKTTQSVAPAALVVDSIQTTFTSLLTSAPGSISQVQEVAAQLMFFAKRSGTPVFLIGHVTKDGAIAGPRTLEHIVDTVLYCEGEKSQAYRILRAVKNRFGSTNEIGVFEMTDAGLQEVAHPSAWLLSERPQKATGSVVVASLEGTRPILTELQALVSPTSFPMPRRTANGVDGHRDAPPVAGVEKRMGLNLSRPEISVNVGGGLRIEEPALGLGIVAAVTSSLRNRPIAPPPAGFGEVGL